MQNFTEIQVLAKRIVDEDEANDYNTVFSHKILERILKLSSKQSSIIQIECGKILCVILSNPRVLIKVISSEREHLLADLINTLILMLEKFDQLPVNRQISRVCRAMVATIVQTGTNLLRASPLTCLMHTAKAYYTRVRATSCN